MHSKLAATLVQSKRIPYAFPEFAILGKPWPIVMANLVVIEWEPPNSILGLIWFKIAVVNEAVGIYGFTPSAAALHVFVVIKDNNKRDQLKRELSELSFEKYAIDRFCSSHSQVINALMNLRSHGITNERIILLNNFLQDNEFKASSYTGTK